MKKIGLYIIGLGIFISANSFASTEIVYGLQKVIPGHYDAAFKAGLNSALEQDAAKEGYYNLLNSYRFTATDIKTIKWDHEYKVTMILKGRDPNMFDDGVFVKILLRINVNPALNEVEIESKDIKIVK